MRSKREGVLHEPPCATCCPPPFPENKEAVNVFLYAIRNLRVAPDGSILGLDVNCVLQLMAAFAVRDKERCLEKCLMLADEFILKKGKRRNGPTSW